jgi:hypothetical protein
MEDRSRRQKVDSLMQPTTFLCQRPIELCLYEKEVP